MHVEFCACLLNVHFPHPETGKRLKTSALESITCSSYIPYPLCQKKKKEMQHCDAGYAGEKCRLFNWFISTIPIYQFANISLKERKKIQVLYCAFDYEIQVLVSSELF